MITTLLAKQNLPTSAAAGQRICHNATKTTAIINNINNNNAAAAAAFSRSSAAAQRRWLVSSPTKVVPATNVAISAASDQGGRRRMWENNIHNNHHRTTNGTIATNRIRLAFQRMTERTSPVTTATAVDHEDVDDENYNNNKSIDTPTSATTTDNREQLLLQSQQSDDSQQSRGVDALAAAGITRDELHQLAMRKPTPLRLVDMYKYGRGVDTQQRLRNAQFLHVELPIRFAQRITDLLTLPHGLSEAAPIQNVATVFLDYLKQIQATPMPSNEAEEEAFTDLLQSMVLDRNSIPISIARGLDAWTDRHQTAAGSGERHPNELEVVKLQEMEEALYRFFTARVGLRFLVEHHVLSSTSQRNKIKELRNMTSVFPSPGKHCGCIQTNCDVYKEAMRVSELVTQQTKEEYGVCPEIDVVDCMQSTSAKPKDFTYVPHHLHYMLGELLENAARVTVQRHMQQQQDLKPIRVVIVKGDEDITIKVADKGGGIPRSEMNNIWKFAHSSTCTRPEDGAEDGFAAPAPIRGFGLALARIYARYFGGELTLKSMEGYGLDAYLHIPRLGDSCENLPLRVRSSPGERDSMPTNRSLIHRNFSTSRTTTAASSKTSSNSTPAGEAAATAVTKRKIPHNASNNENAEDMRTAHA